MDCLMNGYVILGALWGLLSAAIIILTIQVGRNNRLIRQAIANQNSIGQKILFGEYNIKQQIIKDGAETRRKIGRATGEIKTRMSDEERDDQKAKAKARMATLKKGS